MATSPQHVRDSLVGAVEHCYYTGPTAGQMWLHDLSTYLQGLPPEDRRLERLADHDHVLQDAERDICERPHPLVQAFDPSQWLDEYAARAGQTQDSAR
jgi:hypothetical protein